MFETVAKLIVFSTLALVVRWADSNVEPVAFQLAGTGVAVAVGGNLRIVTETSRRVADDLSGSVPVVCSEANPDAIVAFSRSATGTVNITESNGPQGSGSATLTSKKALDLGGRTAGVLALRDGLSTTCKPTPMALSARTPMHSSALILSQYGSLVVALAGTGTARSSPPRFTAEEAAISALLVGGISEHDPTRSSEGKRSSLLSQRRCKHLIDQITAGRLLRSASAKETGARKVESAPQGVDATAKQAKIG